MFEVLKVPAAAEPAPADTIPLASAPDEGPRLQLVAADEPAMPFIEVGGRGKPVEGSPDVLSVSVKAPAPRPEAVPTSAVADYGFVGFGAVSPAVGCEASRPALAFSERGPMTVTYQACRDESPPPAPRLAPELIAYHQPEHAVTQQYRELLGQIAPPSGAGGRALLLISLAPAAGVTTALLNLAICAAQHEGRNTAVVDVNWQRPDLAARLGLAPAPGLHELLSGTASLEQALRPTAVANLYALTAGVRPVGLAALGDALRWVVGWLRQRCELVFLDGPVWQETAELSTLVSAGEEVLLVLTGDEAASPEVRAAARGIGRVGGRLRGLIVTG
jgi:Mrp family chromosome partitioning ATPase